VHLAGVGTTLIAGPGGTDRWRDRQKTDGSWHRLMLPYGGSIITHTHPFNGPLSRTTRVSLYQKGKTNLDFTVAGDS